MSFDKIKENSSIPGLVISALSRNFTQKKYFFETHYQYGENKQQYIVFIMPKNKIKKNKLLVYIHGGGWSLGNANQFRFVGYFFAKLGYASIIAGYRLAPKYRFPCQLDDISEGLTHGIKIAKKHNAKNKIVLIGQSAGAQLATLLAYNKKIKENIAGIIGISGPLNFNECKNKYIKKVISNYIRDTKYFDEANPINCLINKNEKNLCPILCIHGENDPIVEIANSTTFVKKTNQISQGKADLIIVKGGLHSDLTNMFFSKTEQAKEILKWIDKL